VYGCVILAIETDQTPGWGSAGEGTRGRLRETALALLVCDRVFIWNREGCVSLHDESMNRGRLISSTPSQLQGHLPVGDSEHLTCHPPRTARMPDASEVRAAWRPARPCELIAPTKQKAHEREFVGLILIRGRPCGIRTCDQRIKSPPQFRTKSTPYYDFCSAKAAKLNSKSPGRVNFLRIFAEQKADCCTRLKGSKARCLYRSRATSAGLSGRGAASRLQYFPSLSPAPTLSELNSRPK
jgi:hypothetical protein